MTGIAAALGALGVVLVYWGVVVPPSPGSRRPFARLDARVAAAGVTRLDGRRFLGICAGSGAISFLIVAGLTGSAVVALAVALPAASVPGAAVDARARRRRRRFRDVWPDALAAMIASVRAGVSLPEACAALAARGPEELRPPFNAFSATYRSTGSFRAALDRLRAEMADPICDRVAAALAVAHDVGGTDLVRVLRTTADFVRADSHVRKEVEARWSWTVTAARVAAAAPWVVLVIMSTRPEAAAAYDSSSGALVVLVGGVVTVAGYRLMLRAARLPETRRLG